MIDLSGVSKAFDEQEVIKNVTFSIGEGELVVLLGKSGSGKTTLLKMMNRLEEHQNGEIKIRDKSIGSQNVVSLRRSIGYVIQNSGLFPHLTVSDNISVVPRLKKWNKKRTVEKVDELLAMVKLQRDQYAGKMPDQLSGGEQQRIAIARALAGEPDLILMDEPFSALDPITRKSIRDDFRQLQQKTKITVCMVTHDIQEAVEVGDKICLLHHGVIQQYGTPKDLLFKPENAFVSEFFDENRFQAEMGATRLSDITSFLKNSYAVGNESLLECLKKISPDQMAEVMQAFGEYKRQYKHAS